ncbi:TPA: transposase [Streptococcus suis]|nr:transposase [Streptococcus suis]
MGRKACLKKTLTYPVETETITYKRKKAKGIRQAIFSQFTPEIVHHEVQGEDCTCPDCHGQLKEIGSAVQRQELVFIPAQLKRIDHVQHAYKCQACSQKNLSDKIIKAPVPKAPLAHSLGSASISAHTIHQKFNLKVPNYRQEEDWHKLGLPISRSDWADLSSEERLHKRQTELAPLMDEFFDWCREQSVLPGSKLGTALEYSLKYETTIQTVLSDGDLVLSNNMAERAMKTLVMGRKNWLFSQSFEGAKSTTIILSLLKTAKRHELDTEKYMTYLLDNLPNEETLAKKVVLEAYLPWAERIQNKCK